jgi:hypothetical protein
VPSLVTVTNDVVVLSDLEAYATYGTLIRFVGGSWCDVDMGEIMVIGRGTIELRARSPRAFERIVVRGLHPLINTMVEPYSGSTVEVTGPDPKFQARRRGGQLIIRRGSLLFSTIRFWRLFGWRGSWTNPIVSIPVCTKRIFVDGDRTRPVTWVKFRQGGTSIEVVTQQ